MHSYQHSVSGLFVRRDSADTALSRLMQRGLRRNQLRIISNSQGPPNAHTLQVSRGSQISFMLYTVIGATLGFAVGLLVEFMLLVSDFVPLQIVSVVSPAMLFAWCILVGTFLGCAAGTAILWQPFQADTEREVMLVVQTRNERETAIAREVIKASADLYKEADMRLMRQAEVAS